MITKGFSKDTSILMYDISTKKIQDIVENDIIMGDDSKKRIVKNVVNGNTEMYEIIPKKGTKHIVTGDHTLVLKVSNYEIVAYDEKRKRYRIRWIENFVIKEKKFATSKYKSKDDTKLAAENYLKNEVPQLESYKKYGSIVEIKVKDFINLKKAVKNVYKCFSNDFIHFDEQVINIDPYIIGYWLGDGHTDASRITTAEKEVVEYFENYTKQNGLVLKRLQSNGGLGYDISSGTAFGGAGRNVFLANLKKYNLLGNKHIPNEYKNNSKENRLKLLAGLMDSDGHLHNNVYEIVQKREALLDDIVFLVRSLGFKAYKKEVQKTCTNSKNGRVTGTYYQCHISGEGLEEIPVLLERKKAHIRKSKQDASVSGFAIDSLGKKDYFSFDLDNENRFLLDDFTVVHC